MTMRIYAPRQASSPAPATEKQIAFIARLAAERGQTIATEGLTRPGASAAIDRLMAMPKVTVPAATTATGTAPAALAPGIYRDGAGETYKVQASRQDKTRLYAKRLMPIGGRRLAEDGEVVRWTFEYAPGAVRMLTAEMRLTLADAQAFGIQYGVCVVCGALLTDATSVARGIGPICAKRV